MDPVTPEELEELKKRFAQITPRGKNTETGGLPSGGSGQRKAGALQDIENRTALPRYVIPKATKKKFGSYVRRHREQAKKSLATVAKEVGVHETFIAKIEVGERTPHPDKLPRLAFAINVFENDLRKILGLDEVRLETVLDQVAKLAAQISALRLTGDYDDLQRRQEFLRALGHAMMSFERALRLVWPKPKGGE